MLGPYLGFASRRLLLPVGLAMIAGNVANWGIGVRMRTANGQDFFGVIGNLMSTVAVVLLLRSQPGLARHTGPALMLNGVFAFTFMGLRFVGAAVVAVVYGALLALQTLSDPDPAASLVDAGFVGAAVLFAAGSTHLIERAARERFAQGQLIARQRAALAAEQAKSDRLLRNVLPDAVVDRLRDAPGRIADDAADVTVLFADLVGFTPLAARIPAADVVTLLDELFSRFDDLADRHGVTKVKTIGDAYMAVGGVPGASADHPARVVALALDLVDAVAAYARETGRPLAVRVGIHTGSVVAGVIGKRRIGYDLWGDTVNVASRLESHGVPGAVQVSDATRARLAGDARFACAPRGTVDVKGVGPLATWLVARAPSVPAPSAGAAPTGSSR